MGDVTLQFVGCGDAFGSGGRFQACISVRADGEHLLLDCGASSLVALRRLAIDPLSVDAVLLSHLHGDHFGGLPFLVLDAQFGRRERPLTVVGPRGTPERVLAAMKVFFPGSTVVERRFELRFVELEAGVRTAVGSMAVTGYEVPHPSGAPAYALRLEVDGRVVACSGDGGWSEALIEAARGADLFICEAYSFDKPIKFHLSYATLREQAARLDCRRLILTHMSADMLARRHEAAYEAAEDGLRLVLASDE